MVEPEGAYMSRRRDRAVERLDPGMASLVDVAVGDRVANDMIEDRAQELGLPASTGGGMMINRLEVGKCYWVTTQTFPLVGRLVSSGIDYLEFDEAALILADGRTHLLLSSGRAPNMEVEPIGDGVFVAFDQVGFARLWPFPPFKGAV
jgi:hypothetical protein